MPRLKSGHPLPALLPAPPTAELLRVASAFVEPQTARHQADYDLSVVLNRTDVLDAIDRAEKAFAAWRTIRATDEANVFLAALLFAKRWSH